MSSQHHQPTTTELRAAFDRARIIRLYGWTFAKALAAPLIRRALELSALAHARPGQPVQQKLI